MALGLSPGEQSDLVYYLLSLTFGQPPCDKKEAGARKMSACGEVHLKLRRVDASGRLMKAAPRPHVPDDDLMCTRSLLTCVGDTGVRNDAVF